MCCYISPTLILLAPLIWLTQTCTLGTPPACAVIYLPLKSYSPHQFDWHRRAHWWHHLYVLLYISHSNLTRPTNLMTQTCTLVTRPVCPAAVCARSITLIWGKPSGLLKTSRIKVSTTNPYNLSHHSIRIIPQSPPTNHSLHPILITNYPTQTGHHGPSPNPLMPDSWNTRTSLSKLKQVTPLSANGY